MTDLSTPDRISHLLEPTGAIQTVCTLLDHPSGWVTTCGIHLRSVDLDDPCPHCGQALEMETP